MPEPPALDAKINLRLPESLRKAIKIEAAKNGRSTNAEVLRHLEKLYTPYEEATQ